MSCGTAKIAQLSVALVSAGRRRLLLLAAWRLIAPGLTTSLFRTHEEFVPGYGLDELYADQPEVGVERKIRGSSGLIRYDAKNETLNWPQTIKDAIATEKPNAIIGAAASTAPDIEPQPTALSPAAPSKRTDEAKKPADVGKNDKNRPGKESASSKSRRSINDDLDGAPVPPASVGSR